MSLLTGWLAAAANAGLPGVAIFALARLVAGHVGLGLGIGLTAGLTVGMLIGLTGGLVLRLDTGLGTGQRSVFIAGAGAGAATVGGLASSLAAATVDPWTGGLAVGVASGLAAALIVALQRGGAAYLRHYVLRGLLVLRRPMPADLIGFLDAATSLILLRRQDGGYQFIHGLLLDYFASLDHGGPGKVRRSRDNMPYVVPYNP